MDDNIIYYIILGVIYVISRVLKKKPEKDSGNPAPVEQTSPTPTTRQRSPIEDLLKELSQEMGEEPERAKKPIPQVVDYNEGHARKIQPLVKREDAGRGDTSQENISKYIERDKPIFKRDEHFSVLGDENPTLDRIHQLLEDENGIKSAVVMQEIFQRKY